MKFLKALLWYMAGFIIVPILDLVTPKGAKHFRWLDSVYGNPSSDGLEGDPDYQSRVKTLRRFRWSQLRNPVNALLRSYGPNGVVQRVTATRLGKVTKVVTWVNGERYWMIDIELWRKGHLWFGYKLFDDWRPEINSRLLIGSHFENMMILWPLKNKAAFTVLPTGRGSS